MAGSAEFATWGPYIVAFITASSTAVFLHISELMRIRARRKKDTNAAQYLIASEITRIVTGIEGRFSDLKVGIAELSQEMITGSDKRKGYTLIPFPCRYYLLSMAGGASFLLVQRYMDIVLRDIVLLPRNLQPKIMEFYSRIEATKLTIEKYLYTKQPFSIVDMASSESRFRAVVNVEIIHKAVLIRKCLDIAICGCEIIKELAVLGGFCANEFGFDANAAMSSIDGKMHSICSVDWDADCDALYDESRGDPARLKDAIKKDLRVVPPQ